MAEMFNKLDQTNVENEALEDALTESLGESLFLQELLRQMSVDEENAALNYIARMYDINIYQEEED